MNFPIYKSSFPGKLGQEFNRLVEAVNSLRPISTPDSFTSRTTGGVSRTMRAGRKSQGLVTAELTTVREGLDAVECLDADNETVYCLKASGFRAAGLTSTYGVGGMTYGLNAVSAPVFMEYKLRHELLQFGSYDDAFRVIRHVKTPNANIFAGDYTNNADDVGAALFHIYPFYTAIQSNGIVGGLPLLAVQVSEVTLNSSELSIDSSGDVSANYLDIMARAWEPIMVFSNRVETFADAGFRRYVSAFGLPGGSMLPEP
jgi:hypothetical protein